MLYSKYGDRTRIVVQTTGDLLTPKIIAELRAHHVSTISVSGMDDFHAGMLERHDKIEAMLVADGGDYSFFGATPDQWIGKLWPRGRAWKNGLSQATMEDNFCNQWSGGLNFLGGVGAEVSIEPNGNVYPCCLKTKLPIGNLHEAPSKRFSPGIAATRSTSPSTAANRRRWAYPTAGPSMSSAAKAV